MSEGKIVVVEGGDAMGKDTQTKLLAEHLGAVRFSLPAYRSPAGAAILGHLKREWGVFANLNREWGAPELPPSGERATRLNAMVLQSLMMINRLELLPDIKKALQAGKTVVFDRYTPSALVYGAADGLDVDWVELINSAMPPADVCILLDGPVALSFERRPERRDRYEQDRALLQRVHEEYLALFQRAPLRLARAWRTVDAIGSVEDVHQRVLAAYESGVRVEGDR